jgi:amino acid adenylation domain-containing protein
MTNISTAISDLPPEQRAIRAKCFHPTGRFIEFKREEIKRSIPDRFEQMVRRYPDQLAVKTRNHALTYDELNKAANRVARAILEQRLAKETPVVLLIEQGALFITALLGVLKAAKFYVPLDPAFPHGRLAYMLEDSTADLILTNNKNLSAAEVLAQNGCQLLNIDEIPLSLSDEDVGLPISTQSLACIIYTSGSTGQPKGVLHNHCNILHMTMTYTNALHIDRNDRVTLPYSPSTIGGLRTISFALLNGAAIFPFDIKEEGLGDLSRWLIREKITVFRIVPTAFRHFASTLTGEEEFPNIRLIYLGGELIYKRDADFYKRHFPEGCILVTGLGATEMGIVLFYFVDKHTEITGGLVPLGYAVEDTEVLLLGDDDQKVGLHQIGEIAVKSPYLSCGYWRNLKLTGTKFLTSPEGRDRIYKTGDLGRRLSDGSVLYIARKDFQVKIRGHRVEVAEIEMALLDHAAIKEAVVVAREDRSGEHVLVAYLVPTKSPAPNVSELRSVLKDKLPDYMVPSTFVMLDALPLTPNGKVDRRALPAPGRARPELETPYVAPKTPVEEQLVKIWAEVLGLDQVGIQDNFFDLGGHSLLATQVISRVINTFKVEVPIKSLFESPTVADMAVVITENMAKKAGDEELARMLAELESLSDEEAKRRLAEEGK